MMMMGWGTPGNEWGEIAEAVMNEEIMRKPLALKAAALHKVAC